MSVLDVKFYDGGGHSAGRSADNSREGTFYKIPKDRYRDLCNDGPDVLRSPFGLYKPCSEEEEETK
jgi:hypothetical protein